MTRYKWWFYVFNFSADNKVGNGNGMRRFKKAPTVRDWVSVARCRKEISTSKRKCGHNKLPTSY